MPFISVNGLKTFHEDEGKGKPLLLVHGACSDSRIWVNQIAGLSKKLRVIAIDLPGHGKSEPLNARGTIERYAEHVASFMKEIKIQKATIGGISMGGLIVQQLILKHTELFEKLIIVDSAAKIPVPQVALDLYRNQFEYAVKQLTPMSFSNKTTRVNPAVVKRHVEEDLQTNPKVAAEDYEAVGEPDFTDELVKIKVPTLIIQGADDLLIRKEWAEFLHKNIKGSKLEVIPDAGHVNMLEKPDEFNKIVLKFLGR
nr:alpha/beta hydrolase [Candidatus Njordarchaeum guaymaensis]